MITQAAQRSVLQNSTQVDNEGVCLREKLKLYKVDIIYGGTNNSKHT